MRLKVYIARKAPREVEDYIAHYCDSLKGIGSGIIPRLSMKMQKSK